MKKLLRILAIALAAALFFCSCDKGPQPDGKVGLNSIGILKANNSGLDADAIGKIDANTVTFVFPSSLKGTSNFIPTFSATENDVVTIAGKVAESGKTSVTIADGGKILVSDPVSALANVEYTIAVKYNDGAAVLKSIKFAAADNAEKLTEDIAPETIADNMLVRVPAAAFQQKLVLSLEAGEGDVIKIGNAVVTEGKVEVDTMFPIDIEVSDETAGVSAKYVLKVGKILQNVVKHLGTFAEADATMDKNFNMAINPVDGMPYIIYLRKAGEITKNQACVAKWNGTSFETVGNLGFSKADVAAKNAYLSFDKDGNAFATYIGGAVSNKHSVNKLVNGEWQLLGEGINQTNANGTYIYPTYINEKGNPVFFYCGNTKKTSEYRIMNVCTYNGENWSEKIPSDTPKLGENGTDNSGMYYGSVIAYVNGKKYMASAFNEYGFHVCEIAEDDSFRWIVKNYNEEGEKCGLPGNLGLAGDNEGNLYLLEALWSAGVMQLYKVNTEANNSIEKFGAGVPMAFSSSGGTDEMMSFGVNPVNGNIFAIKSSAKKVAPSFSSIDENGQWNEWALFSDKLTGTAFSVLGSDANGGTIFIAYTGVDASGNFQGIELFSYGIEDDVIPE